MWVCTHVHVCMCLHACVHMCVCMHVCVRVHAVILALSVAARRAPAIPRAHTNNSRIERHEAPAVTDTFDGVVGFDESFIWPLHRGVVDDLGREALARVLALVWPSARLTCAGLAAPEAPR